MKLAITAILLSYVLLVTAETKGETKGKPKSGSARQWPFKPEPAIPGPIAPVMAPVVHQPAKPMRPGLPGLLPEIFPPAMPHPPMKPFPPGISLPTAECATNRALSVIRAKLDAPIATIKSNCNAAFQLEKLALTIDALMELTSNGQCGQSQPFDHILREIGNNNKAPQKS